MGTYKASGNVVPKRQRRTAGRKLVQKLLGGRKGRIDLPADDVAAGVNVDEPADEIGL